MILHQLGKVGDQPADQDALWEDIKGHTAAKTPNPAGTFDSACPKFPKQICEACNHQRFCWCTFPSALSDTLTQHLGAGPYDVVTEASELDITARVVGSINANIAPAVLVYGRKHWVVVYGYMPASAGTGVTIGGTPISHIMLHNPEWKAPKNAVTIRHWFAAYLRTIDCGSFKGQWVMVGKPKQNSPVPNVHFIQPVNPPVMAPTRATDLARLEAVRLTSGVDEFSDSWRPAFAASQAGQTLLVREYQNPAGDYYIVDFEQSGRSTGRMILNAQDGSIGELTGTDPSAESIPVLLPPGEVLRLVSGKNVKADNATVEPDLVWKPCDQSKSRFLAFYVVRQGADVVYVRTDGATFAELTERGAG
jgi:hypothetical protein